MRITIGDVRNPANDRVAAGDGAPLGAEHGHVPGGVSPELRSLAARLRADTRVRWVQPLPPPAASDDAQGRRAQER